MKVVAEIYKKRNSKETLKTQRELEDKNQLLSYISSIGPDPLKTTKPTSQHSELGHHRPASELPFKWRFPAEPMMARL